MYKKLERYGTQIHILSLDMSKATKALVTNLGAKTVSEASNITQANLVINGGDYGLAGIPAGLPNSITYSDGKAIQTVQKDYRPWFDFSKELKLSHGWMKNSWLNGYNTVSGDRYVVTNGGFNTAISTRTTKDARTAIGLNPAGNLLIVVADGNSAKNIGLTFPELSAIFIEELGASFAINLDGGGSTAISINGDIKNVPNDDGALGQRRVINHVCVWTPELNEIPLPPDPEIPTIEKYDVTDKLIHEIGGIIVGEYHRWLP